MLFRSYEDSKREKIWIDTSEIKICYLKKPPHFTKEEADWKPITVGIAATETEIEEESEDYYYMDGRGTPESEPATQKITRTFTGHRKLGDPVQDMVFDMMLEDLGKRDTEIIEYYDVIDAGSPNGKRYPATVSI